MSEYITFANSIEVECPFCGNETHYSRKGLDGMLGEGQWCSTCEKWITQCGDMMLDADDVEKFKENVKKYFAEGKHLRGDGDE